MFEVTQLIRSVEGFEFRYICLILNPVQLPPQKGLLLLSVHDSVFQGFSGGALHTDEASWYVGALLPYIAQPLNTVLGKSLLCSSLLY